MLRSSGDSSEPVGRAMSATAALARTMLRRQLVAFVALAVLGGLGVAFAMTAASGARRADSAYTRLREATSAPDTLYDGSELDDQDVRELSDIPEVTGIARFSYTPIAPLPLTPGVDAGSFIGLDPDFLSRVYRPLVLRGRLADPEASDEVVINEALAKAGHLEAGQRVELVSGFEQPASIGEVTIVGVVRGIFDVGVNSGNPSMLLSKAFLDAHVSDVQVGPQPGVLARFARGEDDLAAFQRAASAALGREVETQFTGDEEAISTERTLRVQTVGLWILAALAGIATLVAVAQALSRLLDHALADLPILVAIGVRPRQRPALGGFLALPVVAIGALVATTVAFLASPLIPTGFARSVDPVRGLHLDLTIVVGMAAFWAFAVGGAGIALAWWHRSGPVRPARAQRTRKLLRPLPPRARLGAEAALVPATGKGGLTSRSALATAVVSVTGMVAIATFGSSLNHLLDTPALQGWSFDASIQNGETDLDALRQSLSGLEHDSAVSEIAWVALAAILIEGRPFEAYAFDPNGGTIHPTMRSGRPPLADDEVVLGADLLRGLHHSVGDAVEVSGPDGGQSLVIVGSATYPELGNNGDLGTYASVTRATAQRLGAPESGSAALIRFAPGGDLTALAPYAKDVGEVITPFPPARVRNLEEIGGLPWVLGAFAAGLGLLAIGHGLWASIRARRRELGVLAAIGFRPRDLQAMILWQATCIAMVGALLGLLMGAVLGTRAWTAAADMTAVVDRAVIPVLSLILITGATFVVCSLLGFAAGQLTRRTGTAHALGGE